MKLIHIEAEPFHHLSYRNVALSKQVVKASLPFLKGQVDALPQGLDVIVMAADLQGHELGERIGCGLRLLGECLAEELCAMCVLGLLPQPENIGIILAGDLYARPTMDRRGGSGDVLAVWNAFAEKFRWVTGVAGNHDLFGQKPLWPNSNQVKNQPKSRFLDGNVVTFDGLRIAGLSGVIGNPRKPFRRDEPTFLNEIGRLLDSGPDILVLHDGPDGGGEGQRGWPSVRELMEVARPTLVVRGHTHWENPIANLANGSQIINVDARVVVLNANLG